MNKVQLNLNVRFQLNNSDKTGSFTLLDLRNFAGYIHYVYKALDGNLRNESLCTNCLFHLISVLLILSTQLIQKLKLGTQNNGTIQTNTLLRKYENDQL
jgi:hypothetical protein